MAGTPVELIKEKINVVDFIKGYIQLAPAGKNLKGLCPFHREKTPSFMVSPDRASWHCFGCAAGGDIFSFIMKYENIEFSEALRMLADRAGVELRRVNPAEYKFAGLLYDLNEAAKDYYKKQFEESSEAREYAKSRKLMLETAKEFEIGFAPREIDGLTVHFLNSGTAPDDLIRAGLTFKTERGTLMDRFRTRLMFPIFNHVGKCVGFTGRILPQFDTGASGKYVNSPETPIFNKSKILYGFNKSKDFVREAGSAFLVEGQMDFLMSYQSGIKNVAAASGTALTPDHLNTIRRFADRLIVSFDNDEAGWSAGERAIDLAKAHDFDVRVAEFPGYKDPADVAFDNPEKLKEAVAGARPAMEVYFEKYLAGVSNFSDRTAIVALRKVLSKIILSASPVEQEAWIRDLSRRTGVSENTLKAELKNLPQNSAPPPETENFKPAAAREKKSRWDLIAEKLIGHALSTQNFGMVDLKYIPAAYQPLIESFKAGASRSENPATDLSLERLMFKSEQLPDAEVEFVKNQIVLEYAKERQAELGNLIREAERKKDEARLSELLAELRQILELKEKHMQIS